MLFNPVVTPFLPVRPSGRPHVRLVMLPSAGAGGAAFAGFAKLLDPSIDCLAVEYPGHGRRRREALAPQISAIAAELAVALPALGELPYVLFGHSMGALVGYEIARRLREAGGRPPRGLIASSCRAPHLPGRSEDPSALDDEEFAGYMRALGGTPAELLEDRDFVRLVRPVLAADMRACKAYLQGPDPRLDLDVVAYVGERDPGVTIAEATAWDRVTAGAATLRCFRGGHFYLNDEPGRVASALSLDVLGAVHRRASPVVAAL